MKNLIDKEKLNKASNMLKALANKDRFRLYHYILENPASSELEIVNSEIMTNPCRIYLNRQIRRLRENGLIASSRIHKPFAYFASKKKYKRVTFAVDNFINN